MDRIQLSSATNFRLDCDRKATSPPAKSTQPAFEGDRLQLSNSPGLVRLQDAVNHVIQSQAEDGPWTATDGFCLDLSAKWLPVLQAAGLPVQLTTVEPNLGVARIKTTDGQEVAGKFHAYLTVTLDGQELIIDPTVRQFLRGQHADVPDIFVGTEASLRSLMRSHRADLQAEVVGDGHTGRYDPDAFVDLSHGLGHLKILRVVHSD